MRIQIRENRQNPDPDPTFDFARAVRNAIGKDVELWVDINNGYTVQRASEVGLRLNEEFGVRYYEEPVSYQYHEDSAKVAAALPRMSIIAGEKEYPDENALAGLLGLVQRGFRYEDGYLSVPTTPGLGIEVDEAALRRASTVLPKA